MINVSCLIVARNAEKTIKESVESLINQTYPKNLYEIIIIDGNSTDNTRTLVENIIKTTANIYPMLHIKIINNNKRKLAPGWNIGIKESKGNYIIRIDAHSTISSDYIKEALKIHEKNEDVAVVGGKLNTVQQNKTKKNPVTIILSSPFGIGDSKFRYSTEEGYVDTVAYGVYRKKIFDKLGYFDESMDRNQDLEYHSRIKQARYKFYLLPTIEITYYARSCVSQMLRQAFSNGKWVTILLKKNFKAISIRHLIPFIFILSLLSLIPLSFIHYLFMYTLLSELALYYMLAIIFTIKKSKNIFLVLLMPYIFLIYHLSYGLGTLIGVFTIKKGKKE